MFGWVGVENLRGAIECPLRERVGPYLAVNEATLDIISYRLRPCGVRSVSHSSSIAPFQIRTSVRISSAPPPHSEEPNWSAALDREHEERAATAAKHRQERDALDLGMKALLDRARADVKTRCKPRWRDLYRAHPQRGKAHRARRCASAGTGGVRVPQPRLSWRQGQAAHPAADDSAVRLGQETESPHPAHPGARTRRAGAQGTPRDQDTHRQGVHRA